MISNALKLLCQVFISIILIKSIYCLLVPKTVRKVLSKIGVSVSKLICEGLNGVNNSIPKKPQVVEETPKLKIVK